MEEKINNLVTLLSGYEKAAVAFSGGIDSSFLLYMAGKTLGRGNVVALQAVSCLVSDKDADVASDQGNLICDEFGISLQKIPVYPLQWQEFIVNDKDRCYFCKKRMYNYLKREMEKVGCEVLFDGTNVDDLKDRRPGLRAIRELGVKTPLLDVGLNKHEIRQSAKSFGIANWQAPSNSCLATRIKQGIVITDELLIITEKCEEYLHAKGFSGCRVRPAFGNVIVEIAAADMDQFVQQSERVAVLHFFHTQGFDRVLLDLAGR